MAQPVNPEGNAPIAETAQFFSAGNSKYVLWAAAAVSTIVLTSLIVAIASSILKPLVFVATATAMYAGVVYLTEGPEAFENLKTSLINKVRFAGSAVSFIRNLFN